MLEFGPNDRFLGFDFVALDFDSPEKVRFFYMLEGFDNDWIAAGTRDYATYANLPPGEYRFVVEAVTVRGLRSDPASVDFTIATPWHQTTWAYILYLLCLIILLSGAFKVRQSRLLGIRNTQLALTNKKLEEANKELEILSIRDHLTGIYNRRYFNSRFEEQLNFAKRSNIYLSLVMLDIDNFKHINDRFGHLAGDYLLIDISEAVLNALPRKTDFVARYGGDEMAIVLYDTGHDGALQVLEKIKQALGDIRVRPDFSSQDEAVTVSMGVTTFIPKEDTTSEMIIQATDKALYSAKHRGRNCVCISNLD